MASQSVWAAVTQCPGRGGLNNVYFSQFWRLGGPRAGCWQRRCPVEALFLVCRRPPLRGRERAIPSPWGLGLQPMNFGETHAFRPQHCVLKGHVALALFMGIPTLGTLLHSVRGLCTLRQPCCKEAQASGVVTGRAVSRLEVIPAKMLIRVKKPQGGSHPSRSSVSSLNVEQRQARARVPHTIHGGCLMRLGLERLITQQRIPEAAPE